MRDVHLKENINEKRYGFYERKPGTLTGVLGFSVPRDLRKPTLDLRYSILSSKGILRIALTL